MGIFDFLGDISSKRSKELGLGGLQSLLGTRGAAQAGAIGDEMIGITNKDSLPGYFNEQTREYVPWYVDLFDGGGLNAAGGQAEQEAAQSGAMGITPGGAPIQSPGLLANNQLSDMEMANRNRAAQMAPGLGSQLSDMEMANRNRVSQVAPGLGSQLSDMEMANRNRASQMTPGLGSQLSDMEMANRNRASQMTPGLGSQLSDMEMANRNLASQQAIPASGGNMAINTPAAQGRDQMIADQIDLQQLNEMQAHPLYQNFAQSPFGEGDKKYYPAEFFKYLQTQQSAMPQANPLQNNAEYQEFLRLFSNNAGNDFLAGLGPEFAQRLEDPEFIQRVFEDYMRSRAN